MPSGIDLESLSAECCQSANIINKELLALQNFAGQGRLRAIKSLLTRKLKDGEIQSLKRRLEENQRTLDTKVLIDVRQMMVHLTERQDDQYASVYHELTALAAKLDSCHISAGGNLKTIINDVVESNKHEHQATRMHLSSTIQALTTSQAQKQEQKMRYEQLLESLRFDDIHVRENEVTESHSETLSWVYDDNGKYPWDSLKSWLELERSIYWVNGKAGSGKSTFMKFLVKDERTSKALQIWSGGQDCMVLTFYFWLSGTKLQRSMKGFLCSLLRQILDINERVSGDILQTHNTVIGKRSLGDWSMGELRKMLEFAIESVNRTSHICIFVDGIDEFDQDEDVQHLLDYIKKLAESPRTKFCLSSRPELHVERCLSQYSKLRLQDLTAKDMEICIRDRLDRVYELYPSLNIGAEDIERFFHLMTQKADGVFLWVYFALNSLLKGMSNEDDFEVLLTRLGELPSGMERIYQQMWVRLNGDEQLYRREASLYFSYHELFPRSLFEMTVALNDDIQTKYFQEMRPQDPTILAHKCETLRKRILTRCAGLLEVTETMRDSKDHDSSSFTSSTGSFESFTQHSEDLEATCPNNESQLVDGEQSSSLVNGSSASHSTISCKSFDTQLSAHHSLQPYHDVKIKFLHRTARDFLLDTEAGHAIVGETSQARDDRFLNATRARMAALLEGLEVFGSRTIGLIMSDIGYFDTKDEIELLETLRNVCKTLHVPGSPARDVTLRAFWAGWWFPCNDFVGCAAVLHCTKYVQWHINHATTCLSPYYLGYLFLVLNLILLTGTRFTRNAVQLANSLADKGADPYTPQIADDLVLTPYFQFLETVLQGNDWASIPETAIEVARLIKRLYLTSVKLKEKVIVSRIVSRMLPVELREASGIEWLDVELDGNFLCRQALYHLRRSGIITESIKLVPTRSSLSVKVLVPPREDPRFLLSTPEDSVDLGQGYEKVLIPEDYTDNSAQSFETFISRLKEVIPRCEDIDRVHWQYEVGVKIDLPENALTLDPSEDVDESNWKERGHFRTATGNPCHGSVFTVMDTEITK